MPLPRTDVGRRPELEQLKVNEPTGYIGSKVLPIMKVKQKAGKYYYSTLVADVDAQTARAAGAAPTATTLAESSADFAAAERIKRYKLPWEMIPLIDGLDKSDQRGAAASKRSTKNLRRGPPDPIGQSSAGRVVHSNRPVSGPERSGPQRAAGCSPRGGVDTVAAAQPIETPRPPSGGKSAAHTRHDRSV